MGFVDAETAFGYNVGHAALNPASRHIQKRPREESEGDRPEEHDSKRPKFELGDLCSAEASIHDGLLLVNDTLPYLPFDTPSSVHGLQTPLSHILTPPYRVPTHVTCESRTSERAFIQASQDYATNHSKQYRGVGGGSFVLEGLEAPTMSTRLVLSDELLPMTTLVDPTQLVRAFKDTIKCHECLVRIPKIMHGDISLNNLAYRQDENGNAYGVLIDFDKLDSTTFMRRAGSSAFLAVDLLIPSLPVPHEYYARYDLESFVYVFAWMIGRYEGGQQIANPPYSVWTRGKHGHDSKWSLMYRALSRKVTAPYQDIIHVLDNLCIHFRRGFGAFGEAFVTGRRDISRMKGSNGQPFDHATLDGHVTHVNLLAAFDLPPYPAFGDHNDPTLCCSSTLSH